MMLPDASCGYPCTRHQRVATFRDDPLYPRIERAVAALLDKGKVVAPVDVLVGMGLRAPDRLDDWRRGRIPYLEQVIDSNRSRLSRLRIVCFHAYELKLAPSASIYVSQGTPRKQRLRPFRPLLREEISE